MTDRPDTRRAGGSLDDSPQAAAPSPPAPPDRPSRRASRAPWRALGAALVVLAAGTVLAAVLSRDDETTTPAAVRRDDPVTDLLGWIPATDETRRAFAVWTPDSQSPPGTAAPAPATARLLNRLALAPMPGTVGDGSGWRDRYGYDARDVEGWVAAGVAGRITVLAGHFDLAAIERALVQSGYRTAHYHGAPLYVLHDPTTPLAARGAGDPANAVALFAGRLITADGLDAAQAVIDAAQGRAPSLADDARLAPMLRTLAPMTALMAVDAADHAVACGIGGSWSQQDLTVPSGGSVVVAYGRAGRAGLRRTLVAMVFPNEAAAVAADPAFETGWRGGAANAGGAGGRISSFGAVNAVSRTGSLLVAELVAGREDGWVRAGIRFAIPVCEAASAALPTGTPVGLPAAARPSGFARALGSLPDTGVDSTFLVADLAATEQAHGGVPPARMSAAAVQQWLDALGPLPAFTAFPLDASRLATWPATFGIPLSSVTALAETRPANSGEAVAVLIGTWNPDDVATALRRLGYASVQLGQTLHFALGPLAQDPSHPAHVAGGQLWDNVAIVGDRLFLSSSIRALRQAVDLATGVAPVPTVAIGHVPVRDRLLLVASDATAAEVIAPETTRHRCADRDGSAVVPGWLGLAAIWSARPSGDAAAVAVYPPGDRPLASVAADLDKRVRGAALTATATPGAAEPLVATFGYRGVASNAIPDTPSVLVAQFNVPTGTAGTGRFFQTTSESCRFDLDF